MKEESKSSGVDQEGSTARTTDAHTTHYSRREFLRTSLIALAGVAVANSLIAGLPSEDARMLYVCRNIRRDGNSITHEVADFTRHEFYRLPNRAEPWWWCEMRGVDGTLVVDGAVIPSGTIMGEWHPAVARELAVDPSRSIPKRSGT